MKIMRSYGLKIAVLLLVVTGFCLPMMQPARASVSNRMFDAWLHSIVRAQQASPLGKKLEALDATNSSVNDFIKKASRLIKDHHGQFSGRLAADRSSKNLYRLLLLEWNQYQSNNRMNALLVFRVNSQIPAPRLKYMFAGTDNIAGKKHVQDLSFSGIVTPSTIYWDHFSQLLVGSIVIGAP